MDDSISAYTITVYGVVQGVGFRYFTKQRATALGLFGTVENQSDGSVYIQVEGVKDPLASFLEWCHSGPPSSTVIKLDYKPSLPQAFTIFDILR